MTRESCSVVDVYSGNTENAILVSFIYLLIYCYYYYLLIYFYYYYYYYYLLLYYVMYVCNS